MTISMINFEDPINQPSIIKVIGVGGGGSNAVNHMFMQGIQGVEFIVCNTDLQALNNSPVPNKIALGANLTKGRGAGNNPEKGKEAAIESIDEIKAVLSTDTEMVFITSGMGGGTGTGAAPVIAKVAKEMGILTVAIVTMPFTYEAQKRHEQAEKGINELKNYVDTILVICNQKLIEIFGDLPFTKAFAKADDVLSSAAKSISEIISDFYYVNVDFEDVKAVMKDGGVAIMGSAMAEGEDRARKVVYEALESPLLNDNSIRGARKILLNITSGDNDNTITNKEIEIISDHIHSQAGKVDEFIYGIGINEALENRIKITIVATDFDRNAIINTPIDYAPKEETIIIDLNEDSKPEVNDFPTQKPIQEEFEYKVIETVSETKVEENEEFETEQTYIEFNTHETYSESENTIELTVENNMPVVNQTESQSDYIIHTFETEERIEEVQETKLAMNREDYSRVSQPIASSTNLSRKEQLKQYSQTLRESSVDLQDVHNNIQKYDEPTYKRRNIQLPDTISSDESYISMKTLDVNPNENDINGPFEIKAGSPFFKNNPD